MTYFLSADVTELQREVFIIIYSPSSLSLSTIDAFDGDIIQCKSKIELLKKKNSDSLQSFQIFF